MREWLSSLWEEIRVWWRCVRKGHAWAYIGLGGVKWRCLRCGGVK